MQTKHLYRICVKCRRNARNCFDHYLLIKGRRHLGRKTVIFFFLKHMYISKCEKKDKILIQVYFLKQLKKKVTSISSCDRIFRSTKRWTSTHLWDVDSGPEELQVLPHLLRFELGVQNSQLGEHAHVCALQAERRLQQSDELLKVASVLVVADQVLQLIGVDHNVEAADLRQAELLAVHAGKAHLEWR